jgi:hypothetical protein
MIKYILPPFIIDVFSFVKSFGLNVFNFHLIWKNSKLKNTKYGKSVFVIANGPSLKNFNIPSLYGKEVIVMNNFNLAEWKDKVSIVAHCIGEPNNSSHWGPDQIEIMTDTNSSSYWFHISNAKEVKSSPFSFNKKYYFISPNINPGLWNWKIDLSLPVLGYQTTAQMAIMVALHLGYKEVNLIGFDHDWLANRNVSPHFYKERKGVRKADLSIFPYYNLITISKNMWKIYMKLNSSSKKMKVKITNLSKPSFLDVFDN